MLVLISFGLLLVATVLLVLGLLSASGLGLIYLSIASSVVAGIVLVVAVVLRRPSDEVSTAPAQRTREQEAPSVTPAPTMEAEPTAPVPAVAAAPTYAPARRPAMATVGGPASGGGEDEDDFFPIEDYDDLKVAEILPLVPELYPDELDMVEERERATKGRVSVLKRIDQVRQGAAGDTAAQAVVADGDVATDRDVEPAGATTEDDFFPIEEYDDLTVGEIMPLLPELYADELDVVERHERNAKGRVSIINRITELREASIDDTVPDDSSADEAEPEAAAVDEAGWEEPVPGAPEDDFFPIADYDDLTVGEVLPLLPELYADELDVVEDHERATKGRAVVLSRLAELRDAGLDDSSTEGDEGGAVDEAGWEEPVPGAPEDDFFPIADYDDLTVGEIMPLLPELYADELDVVEDHERATKGRALVLSRLAELRDERTDEADVETGLEVAGETEGEWEVPDEGWTAPTATVEPDEDLVDEDLEVEEDVFPIVDYDQLRVPEVRSVLPLLTEDELEVVRAREIRGANRISVIVAIDRELGIETPPPAPPVSTTPASRRAAKKAPAKKAPAKKAPAKKAPAKKASAKKAPSVKRAVKKEAAAPTKATTKKATATKATAKKAAPAKATTKKAPTKKAPAKAAAKKAPAKRTAKKAPAKRTAKKAPAKRTAKKASPRR